MNTTNLFGAPQAAAALSLIGATALGENRNDLYKQILVALANKTGGGGGTGDVVGPASSTDGAVALWDGVTGKLLKDSTVFITGSGTLAFGAGPFTLTVPATGTAALLGVANTFSAANIFTVNGAASTPAVTLSGTPYAGTGTTSFPLLYLNQSTATASTTLNTAGTFFGINSHGTQDLMNLMVDGVTKFKVDYTGITSIGSSAIVGSTVMSLIDSHSTITFGITGAGDLLLSSGIVTKASGVLRFGFTGGTDPILTASASTLTLSQATFDAPSYKVGGVAGVSGTITAASTVTVVNGIVTNIA